MKQPTSESIHKAYDEGCDDVKKVIKNLWPDEFKDGYDEKKIWAHIDRGRIFIAVNSAEGWRPVDCDNPVVSYDSHSTLGECIKQFDGFDWRFFNNQKDFFEWALKQVS